MSQGYPEMYQDYSSHRSPGSTRGYNGTTLNRQPSRQFANDYQQMPTQYIPEYDGGGRYDTERFGRALPTPVPTHGHYDSQTWNYGGANGIHSMTGGRLSAPSRGRPAIPNNWLDVSQMSLTANHSAHQMNGQYSSQTHLQNTRGSPSNDGNEELIPTAIVIKNIPFAVKKESLMDLMTNMNLPLPYAFNYHFDNGVFRGLAFANFTNPEETKRVIDAMNHLELQGRKLRVEYKKMLPQQEREKIERDKREKRGQLQEQHQPMSLHHQGSLGSMNSAVTVPATSTSPVNMRSEGSGPPPNIDFNDPVVLEYYSTIVLFRSDPNQDAYVFDPSVSPEDRRTIHTLAHYMGLQHQSEGNGDSRQVTIYKKPQNTSPPAAMLSNGHYTESHRRVLNRAATTDFSEARGSDPGYYGHSLNRQRSDLLDIPGSPGVNTINERQSALRGAKSFSELRSFSPSPAPTTASFPANLAQNVSHFNTYGLSSGASGTPQNLTPTSAGAMNGQESLINSFNTLGLSGYERQSSAPRIGGRLVGQSDRDNQGSAAGPIGSQRPINGHHDEGLRSGPVVAERQPRGPPANEWGNGTGFGGRPRQNGHVNRGSGELDLSSVQRAWDDNISQDSSDRSIGPHSSSRYGM